MIGQCHWRRILYGEKSVVSEPQKLNMVRKAIQIAKIPGQNGHYTRKKARRHTIQKEKSDSASVLHSPNCSVQYIIILGSFTYCMQVFIPRIQ